MTNEIDIMWPWLTYSQLGSSFFRSENYVPSLNPFGDDDEDDDDDDSGGCDGDTASVVKDGKDARPARPQRKPQRKNSDTKPK